LILTVSQETSLNQQNNSKQEAQMLTSIKTNEFVGDKSKKLAMMYFRVAIILFGAQLLMGLIAAIQFLVPGFLF